MSGQSPSSYPGRVLKAGGPPALITAGIGVGATGVAGQSIESETDPIATGLAESIGVDPQFGPALLLAGALVIMAVAFVVPGLFDDSH